MIGIGLALQGAKNVPDLIVSQNGGTQNRSRNTLTLFGRTPERVPLILGNSHLLQVFEAQLGLQFDSTVPRILITPRNTYPGRAIPP